MACCYPGSRIEAVLDHPHVEALTQSPRRWDEPPEILLGRYPGLRHLAVLRSVLRAAEANCQAGKFVRWPGPERLLEALRDGVAPSLAARITYFLERHGLSR